MLRTIVWITLLVAGLVAVLAAIIFTTPKVAVAAGILAVVMWGTWGWISSHYYGIRRHVVRHLGRRWNKGGVVQRRIRTADRVNVQSALNLLRISDDAEGSLFGVPVRDYGDRGVGRRLLNLIESNFEPVAINWENLPHGPGRTFSCADNALYLLRCIGKPACILVDGQSKDEWRPATLQVLAHDRATAQNTLDEILARAQEGSPYRGEIISIERRDRQRDDFAIQFHEIEPVKRGQIILPAEVLDGIERNVLRFFAHAGELRKAGQGTRHGILLHGPPGTGKTLVTRYLAQAAAPATVVLVTGRQYAYLRPSLQLARLLAPSLVILEDVDLIATDRKSNRHTPLLHELMDEMDGLGSASDCIFLLTTNRPDAIEPALAARPGRIDQAIHFPLPDAECRRRLFAEFGSGVELGEVDVEALVGRTEGASPAFLKEMFRRATLMALERGEKARPVPLREGDFEGALREIVEFGGQLTRNFLGFPGGRTLPPNCTRE